MGWRPGRGRSSEAGQLRELEADLVVLLAEEDVAEVGRVLQPGSTATVLVWENVWAVPFGAAVRPHPDAGTHGAAEAGGV